jgi:hypothetical protein
MKKLIVLPFILFILNFNAQKDGDIYNIISFVSDNIELIKNTNPKKVKDRIKFNYLLKTHIKENSGFIDTYLFQFRLIKELKLKMSNDQNYIKFKNRMIVSLGAFYSGVVILPTVNFFNFNNYFFFRGFIQVGAILTVLLTLIPKIGLEKIRVQLLKDYFLSISSANTN